MVSGMLESMCCSGMGINAKVKGLQPNELAERLTAAGCEVGEIHSLPGGDSQLVAEVTSYRPDWLCHYGIARDKTSPVGESRT